MLKCGFSKLDITPQTSVELCGYGYFLERYGKRTEAPLYARALAFDTGSTKALLISCDLIGFDKKMSDALRKEISVKYNTCVDDVLLCATHTHCGPATCTLYGLGEIDEQYMKYLYNKLLEAAAAAFNDIDEVIELKSGAAPIEPLGYNRTGYSDVTDNLVKGFTLKRAFKKAITAVSYGCHPVTLGRLDAYSPDYPGKACDKLEQEGFEAIFLAGLQGDIDPVQNKKAWGSGTDEIISEYGKRLSDGLLKKLENTASSNIPEFKIHHLTYELKLQHLGEQDFDAAQTRYDRKDPRYNGINRTTDKWVDTMRKKLKDNEDLYHETLDVSILKLGDTILVGFPHEVFTLPQLVLKHWFPHNIVICMGNVNYTNRYYPTSEDILKGGYAAASSHMFYMNFPVAEGELERITLELISDLKKIL